MKKNPKEIISIESSYERLKHFFEENHSLDAELAMNLITHQLNAQKLTLAEYESLIEIVQYKVFANFALLINSFHDVSKRSWQQMIKEAHQAGNISTQQRIALLAML